MDEIRQTQQLLADPASLGERDLAAIFGQARAVVAVTCSIHATEVGGSQMSMELAYHYLASSDTDRVREILDNVVLLLVPSMNPDGLVRVKGLV